MVTHVSPLTPLTWDAFDQVVPLSWLVEMANPQGP